MASLTVTLRIGDRSNGYGATAIEIRLSDDALETLTKMASDRGKTVEETIIEALRLEKLFADVSQSKKDGLLLKRGSKLLQLEAV